jgi:hypothetical protein
MKAKRKDRKRIKKRQGGGGKERQDETGKSRTGKILEVLINTRVTLSTL